MSGTDGIIRIFAGTASKGFAQKMCDYLGTQMGDCSTIIFSEGNTFVRINESIRDKDVYFVQTLGLDPNNEFAELLFFLDAFKRASANSVTAIIPYFSYAKGDKKDEPRVSIRARVCAECIELAGADRVVTMDLHAAQVQGLLQEAGGSSIRPVPALRLCPAAKHCGTTTWWWSPRTRAAPNVPGAWPTSWAVRWPLGIRCGPGTMKTPKCWRSLAR